MKNFQAKFWVGEVDGRNVYNTLSIEAEDLDDAEEKAICKAAVNNWELSSLIDESETQNYFYETSTH